MMELDYHHVSNPTIVIASGKYHQWMVNLVGKSIMKNWMFM